MHLLLGSISYALVHQGTLSSIRHERLSEGIHKKDKGRKRKPSLQSQKKLKEGKPCVKQFQKIGFLPFFSRFDKEENSIEPTKETPCNGSWSSMKRSNDFE